jgi:bifunctional non-homologous end joining protein LigD
MARKTIVKEEEEILRIGGHEIKVTRPEKILFPEDGITKGDLIRYYEQISPRMIPYLAGRPLALQRFPDGIERPGFFQKAAAPYYPGWIEKVTVQKAGGTVTHVVANESASLVYLANQACITPHPWLSLRDRLQFPDQMILDLDPSADDVAGVIHGANLLKDLLDEAELPAYVKSTGSRGLHVVVPLDREQDFDSVRAFARKLAEALVSRDPERFTLEQRKNKRGDRVLVDVNRNAYAQTAVANYAVRARPGAPISVPLHWSELREKDFRPDGVTIKNIHQRLARIGDPWQDFWQRPASVARPRRRRTSVPAAG